MSKTALVCEKWDMPLIDGKSGFFEHTNVGELSRRAICFEWLLNDIPQDKTVIEYFGGIGLQSVIIQELLKPSSHSIYDLDDDCVEQLQNLAKKYPGISAEYGDSHQLMGSIEADIVFLDFPNMTAKKYEDWKESLARTFEAAPKLVEITDVGNRYLHLHRPLYSRLLQAEITSIEDYINALSKFFYLKYGYSVIRAAYKSSTSYMILGQTEVADIDFFHVTSTKEGFRYLSDR